MNESRVRFRQRWWGALAGVLALAGIVLLTWRLIAGSRSHVQMQTDPNVATVWVLGITHGPTHTLNQGSPLQKWLNACHIHAFGDYHTYASGFNGDPDSLEIWFDYTSYLPRYPDLECHRVGQTAFVDDLGQSYHGYLDFQGKVLGVYLPGYDHAAHRLTCCLHWMPRQPAPPTPVSRPMVFTIDLPPARRLLPPVAALPRGPVMATSQGITVTVDEARLSAPRTRPFTSTQRDLAFRLKIEGGELACSNVVANEPNVLISSSGGMVPEAPMTLSLRRYRIGAMMPRLLGRSRGAPAHRRFTLTDPYGVTLLPATDAISPMPSLSNAAPLSDKNGTVYIAPVNGAGRSTDAVRMRFDVRPLAPGALPSSPSAPLVPFDIVVPVQTNDEA
ncbi:MAG TPA: hypothetical protein VFA07_20085 [Chthonomonadaceae bacterium]|nr:hypothetical protein [Chthonomonadaceae bacterium]